MEKQKLEVTGVDMKNHREVSVDFFDLLSADRKNFVMECVACFQYRNGKRNHDGSLGVIRITPKELNDILAYAMEHSEHIT